MADVGRPRKPTVVKEREGTLRADRVSEAEPEWPVGSVEPPKWLKGEGLAEWHRLVPLLVSQGLFPASAYSQVAGICRWWGKWMRAEEKLEGGEVFTTEKGYQSPSPYVAMARDAWSNYMTACGRFGLDPASMGKVTARPPKSAGEDELARERAARRAAR